MEAEMLGTQASKRLGGFERLPRTTSAMRASTESVKSMAELSFWSKTSYKYKKAG